MLHWASDSICIIDNNHKGFNILRNEDLNVFILSTFTEQACNIIAWSLLAFREFRGVMLWSGGLQHLTVGQR